MYQHGKNCSAPDLTWGERLGAQQGTTRLIKKADDKTIGRLHHGKQVRNARQSLCVRVSPTRTTKTAQFFTAKGFCHASFLETHGEPLVVRQTILKPNKTLLCAIVDARQTFSKTIKKIQYLQCHHSRHHHHHLPAAGDSHRGPLTMGEITLS
jgi:hypothetical protein